MASDFFVTFDSDASNFATKLRRDLAPAKAEIAALRDEIRSIGNSPEEQAGLRRLKDLVTALGVAEERLNRAMHGGGTSSSAGAGGGETSKTGRASLDLTPVQNSINAFTQKMDSSGTELNNAVDHLLEGIQKFNVVLTGLESQTRLMGKVAEGVRDQQKHENQSRAARERVSNYNRVVGGTGLLDKDGRPIGGRFASAGAPGSISEKELRRAFIDAGKAHPTPVRGTPGGAPETVSIANTPRVLVDEAAFQRVVDAVQHNTKATEDVSAAVRQSTTEIIQALNSRDAESGHAEPSEAVSPAQREEMKLQKQAQEEVQKSRAEARAERQTMSRMNARQQRLDPANALTPTQRINMQALLDVPSNAEQFRSQAASRTSDLTRARLEEIATAFRTAGYVVPNAKSKSGLAENILQARGAYEAAGGTTLLNLGVTDRQRTRIQADSVPRQIWDILGGQDGEFRKIVSDDMVEWTKKARAEAIKQGGDFGEEDPFSASSRKQHRYSSGAELAGTRESGLNGMYPQGIPEELLRANQWLQTYNNVDVPWSALERASQLMSSKPGLNIYDRALDAQIEGSGAKAQQAREMLRHLRQATTALDNVRPDLSKMPDVSRPVRTADDQERFDLDMRLQDVNYDKGAQQRRAWREARLREDEERSRAAREEWRQRQVLPSAAREAAFGARTTIGATQGQAATARLLPGIGLRGNRLENFDLPEEGFQKVNSAFNSWIAKLNQLPGKDATPDERLKAEQAGAAAWERVLTTYERQTGRTLETTTRSVGDQQYRDYSVPAQYNEVLKDLAADKRARQAFLRGGGARQETTETTSGRTPPPPPTTSAPKPSQGGEGGILREILAAINSLHATVKSGVRVTGISGRSSEASSRDSSIAAAVNQAISKTAIKTREPSQFGTPEGRDAYLKSLDDTVRRLVTATNRARDERGRFVNGPDASVEGQRLAGAAAMVSSGQLSKTSASQLIGTLHGLSPEETADFQAKLSARIQDSGLASATEKANRRAIAQAEIAAAQEARHAEQTRASTLVQNDLAETMNRVSSSAASQVQVLRELVAAGADATQVAAQEVAVYRALDKELESQGLSAAPRRNNIRNVLSDAEGRPVSTEHLNAVARSAKAGDVTGGQGKVIGTSFGNDMGMSAQGAFERVFFGNHGFWSRILNSTGTFVVRNFSAALVFGLTAALRSAIETGIQTESTFIRVSDALEQTGRSSEGLRSGLGSLAEEYGVALKDVYETAAGLTGLFDKSDVGNVDLLSLTRIATQLQLISGGALNATEAMRALASVTSAFAEVSNEHVADVATAIQNELGVNIEETIEGVARLSGQAKQLGFSFEGAATYVAAIAKFTNMTGAGAGEQFSRILASLQTARTQQIVIKSLGSQGGAVRDMFNTGDYEGVVQTLLRSYSDLDEAEKNRIATALGGQRQAAAVNGLLIKGAKVLDTVTSAQHSQGVAEDRARQISDQLASEIDRVGVAFERFFQILVRSGSLGIAQVGLEAILKTLGLINWTMDHLNDLFESNSITKAIRDWGLTLLGVVATFKLLQRAYLGVKAASAVAGGMLRSFTARALPEAAAQGASGAVSGAVEGGILARMLAGRRNRFEGRPNLYSMAPLVLAGSSALTAPRRFNLDAEGIPSGRLAQFYARRSIGLQERGVRLAGRADRLRTAATASADAAVGGKLLASERALNAARKAGAVSATAASRAMGGLSTGMAFFSRHAFSATVAMAAMTVGLGLMINAFINASQDMSTFNEEFDKDFGPESKKEDDSKQAELTNKYKDSANRVVDRGTGGLGGFLSLDWFENLFEGPSFEDVQKEIQETGSFTPHWEASGDRGTKLATDTFKKLSKAAAEKNVDKVTAINTAANKAIDEELDKIRSDPQMSAWEKNDLTAFYSDLKSRVADSADRVIATAHGLDSVLTSDQLAELPQLLSQMRSTNPALKSQLGISTFLASLSASQGFSGDIQRSIAKLAGVPGQAVPGTGVPAFTPPTALQQLESSRDILQKQLPYAIDKWQKAEESGAPDEDVDKAKEAALNILNGLGDTLQQISDAQTQAIQDALSQAQRVGDTGQQKQLAAKLIARYKERLDNGDITEGEYQGQVDQIHSQLAADLNAQNEHFATMLQAAGGNRRAIADAQLRAAQEQLRLARIYKSQDEINRALQAQAQATAAWREAVNQSIRSAQELAIAQIAPGNTEEIARQQAANAQDALNQYIINQGGGTRDSWDIRGRNVTSDDAYIELQKEAIDKQNALQQQVFDGINTRADAMVSIAQASGDGVRAAQAQLDADLKKLEQAREIAGGAYTPEVQAAEARVRADQVAVSQANGEVIDSMASISVAVAEAAGDAVGAARIKLASLQTQLARARSRAGGVNTSEVLNLEAQIAQQQAALRDAQAAILDSYANLAIVTAEAAGNTVQAAKLRLQQAQAALARVEAAAGGMSTQGVIDARTQVTQANAALRDAQYQDQMDAIDFSMQMEQITSNQAISLLQAMLKAGDLTERQRRDVMLKIHGLQDDIRNTLTGSGFNIPSEIKLPTPYEVRRSLGIDAYQGMVKDSVASMKNIIGGIGPVGATNAGNLSIYNELLSAIKGMSSGTSVNQDIQITNQVQTPAMVETIARRVVQLIDAQTSKATRANTSTPALVQS